MRNVWYTLTEFWNRMPNVHSIDKLAQNIEASVVVARSRRPTRHLLISETAFKERVGRGTRLWCELRDQHGRASLEADDLRPLTGHRRESVRFYAQQHLEAVAVGVIV